MAANSPVSGLFQPCQRNKNLPKGEAGLATSFLDNGYDEVLVANSKAALATNLL